MSYFSSRHGVPGVPASFIPRGGSQWNAPLWGPIWFSFFFISYPISVFLISKTPTRRGLFWPLQFFIPRCGSYAMLPYGVPFDSLSFLYLPSSHFFEFKILLGLSRFLARRFFITRRGGPIKDPYGFPIWDLSVLYLSRELFFDFKNQ